VSSSDEEPTERDTGAPLSISGVGILSLVADQVSDRETTMVNAIDRLAIALPAFKRVEHPPPSKVMLPPFGMPTLNEFAGWVG
jgi:hypothetical protein